MPRPMQTSQAATVMTTSASTCPSPLPHMREKAMSARLAPLSISSRHSRMTSGLRRVMTPTAPSTKTIAETARYQAMLTDASPCSRAPHRAHSLGHGARERRPPPLGGRQGSILVLALQAASPPREHDRADGSDE